MTYLLIHGAWHGGWCWQRVSKLLRAAGHDVFTPTLTGLGEREHLLTREVGLYTHIEDILQVLRFEDLHDVIMVGHSYSGMVITGVAEAAPERIAQLVYLDAFVPADGQSICDFRSPELLAAYQEQVRVQGEGYKIPPLPAEAYGIISEDDIAWVNSKLTAHPFKTHIDKLRVADPRAAKIPRAYIYCTDPPAGPLDQFAQRLRDDRSWKYREIATGHDAMITEPELLTSMLLEFSR